MTSKKKLLDLLDHAQQNERTAWLHLAEIKKSFQESYQRLLTERENAKEHIMCAHCGQLFKKEVIKEHIDQCAKSPLVQRIKELSQANEKLECELDMALKDRDAHYLGSQALLKRAQNAEGENLRLAKGLESCDKFARDDEFNRIFKLLDMFDQGELRVMRNTLNGDVQLFGSALREALERS